MSLATLGTCLNNLGRLEEALAARREAVATLAPYFLRWPARHAQWMAAMARTYLESCEGLGIEPATVLLAPIAEVFQKLQSSAEGPHPNA